MRPETTCKIGSGILAPTSMLLGLALLAVVVWLVGPWLPRLTVPAWFWFSWGACALVTVPVTCWWIYRFLFERCMRKRR